MIETVPSGTILHGRYRIERVLGSGGFGHVYLAVDLTTNQPYAVKEYLVTGPTGQEQLQHEATVLSHLHHPNLPAFLDAFIELGRYYVVLNYIEGNDLTDLIRIARQRNEPIPIAQIIQWLLAICDAVMFLHSQHPAVIHRDIKPDNIRITSNGTAVLVDLGNAKAAADGARTLFFIRHQGTPGYAPPEQYPGGSGTDARSDVYALGGTLYFALATQEPPSVSVRNQNIQQNQPSLPSLQEILTNNPPEETPEAHAARQFRLGVTKPGKPAPRHLRHVAQLGTLPSGALKQLNTIIQKSMALKPKDRYQYVADLANDLKRVAMLLPVTPTPSGRPGDPNSTQPDLPGIYDAIQAAKEQQQMHQQQDQANPPRTPQQESTTRNQPGAGPQPPVCPRCGSQLVAGAAFCPRCGTPLNSGPARPQTNNQAQGQQQTPQPKRDISAEQTLLITQDKLHEVVATSSSRPATAVTPQTAMMQPGRNAAPNTSTPGFFTSTNAQIQTIAVSPHNTAQVQTTNGPSPAQASSAVAPWTAPSSQPRDGSFKLEKRMILVVSILLAILVIIAVILLLRQHTAHVSTILAL